MTEHFERWGAIGVDLRGVGCVDCSTEAGWAIACCRGLRCADCHLKHIVR